MRAYPITDYPTVSQVSIPNVGHLWYNRGMANEISTAQSNSLKLEVLREYFNFSEGKRPTAESVAEKLGLSSATVKKWLADNQNIELLDEITPIWQNVSSGRQVATEHLPEAFQVIIDTMRKSKSEKLRLEAAMIFLNLAGVKAPTGPADGKGEGDGKRPAVLLNLFLGGTGEPVQIVNGEAREIRVEKPEVKALGVVDQS